MTKRWPTALLAGPLAFGVSIAAAVPKGAAAKNEPARTTTKAGDAVQTAAADTHSKGNQAAAEKQSQKNKAQNNTGNKPSSAKKNGQGNSAHKQPAGFGYHQLIAKAKARAKKGYHAPAQIPQFLAKLPPPDWEQIHYRRADALWKDEHSPFQVMFYHPGSFYSHAVTIHVVNGKHVRTFAFDKDNFDYPNTKLKKKVPKDLGYAGFKVLHELGSPGKLDEVLSFLGASYFRALGAHEHYGLSARGLAIDTGSSQGEEFPNFVAFWLVKPDKAKQMTLYALLDSPSVTGAYKFVLIPGQATHTHVEATLFPRKAIAKLGVAPLTSMFTRGENSLARLNNSRPEAHDSDGMLISSANGEWLWRPLVDPQKLRMNQFDANHIRGFGLSQRDRKFAHYQALNKAYQRRPNAWITPDGHWGKGHLEVVEIPSDSPANDNMVLYWIPKAPVKAGQRLRFAYDIKWSSDLSVPESLGHVAATHVGLAAPASNQIRVAIDFVGGKLAQLKAANAVQPKVNAMRDVTLNNIRAVRNPYTHGWRLVFLVPVSALSSPLELRAYLAGDNGGGLTETWSYALKNP